MDSLMELSDLIAENPTKLAENLSRLCNRCPSSETLLQLLPSPLPRAQINSILAVARFLSKCPNNHLYESPISIVLAFYRSIPSSFHNPHFWPQGFTFNSFFHDFFAYVCKACEICSEFSADVARYSGDVLVSVIGNGDSDVSKAVLNAMCCNFPPVVVSDANKLVLGLLEQLQSSIPRCPGSCSTTSGFRDGRGGGNGSFEVENVDIIEKREIALRLMSNVMEKVSVDANLLDNVRVIVKQQLQSMIAFLKIRMLDSSEQGESLKVKINAMLTAYKAAIRLQITTLDFDGKSSKILLQDAIDLLIEAAKECLSSVWRQLRACEELFSSLLSGITRVAVTCNDEMLGFLLERFKPLVLVTCAQAATCSSNQGPMFESMLKATCEIVQFGWYKDPSPVHTFITYILEKNRYEKEVEKVKQTATSPQLNIIRLLADRKFSVKSPEVVDMILSFFIERLDGDASVPGLLRLRLLDAVASMASLGFEKSYREAVVLMTRSYLSKLAAVGSAESKTAAPEDTEERVETLPAGFLLIARDLTNPKLRTDYRYRLLSLCSDVGLVAKSKSGKSGADFLGPLLPAIAEICSDSDPTVDVEPSLLKLFRNLWFYVVLFGLTPPLQNHHDMTNSVASTLNSVGSMGAISLQAVSGPYMWRGDWSSAVQRISQGTPPLVVSSVKWLKDELELNALYNPGSRRGSDNDKSAVSQRTALSAALRGCIEVSAIKTISGVNLTYLLAVTYLEITRFSSNGGILSVSPSSTASRSAFSCVFEYLKSPGLLPAVSQCLTAIVHRAFETAVAWLENRMSETWMATDCLESALSTHASFLIKNLSQRDEHLRDISVNFLNQLTDRFPQILWNSSCLDSLLFSVHNDPPSSVVNDPACDATIHLLYQRSIREWIIASLSHAPCTSQGLLQEKLCKANTWQKSLPTAVVSFLSEIKIGTDKIGCWTGTETANVPAVMAAAVAASGAKLKLTEAFNLEVLNTGMISAAAKCKYAGEVAGVRRLYESIGSLDLPALGPGNMVENLQPKTEPFPEVLLTKFVRLLQIFFNVADRGGEVDKSSFHETCCQATALLLSDLGSDSKSNVERFTKLLRLLCWCPAYILTLDAMETGVFIWTWLVSAAPQLTSLVLAELVDAWLWTVDTKHGLFASEVRYWGPAAMLRPHLGPGEPEAPPNKDPVEQIMAHRLWLGFFIDQFEVIRHNSVSQLLLLGRLLQGTTKQPWNFSSHPAATGTFFTLMLLGLKFCSCKSQSNSQNFMAGFQLLEDRIYRASLGWFAHQPQWYTRNKSFALSEAQSVSIFVHLLNEQVDTSLLDSKGRALTNGRSSNDAEFNGQKDQYHPVWGQMESYAVGREKRKQLLLILCQHEADRLDVWAKPTAKEHTSRLKFSSEKWVDFARTSFFVDPRITLCLAARFPTNNHLKAEVTQLVQEKIERKLKTI